jgi:Patatin-like phospholipase
MPNNDSTSLKLDGKRVVLLLQGGGALGAYQVGAYAALEAACQQANNKLEWVGGISIGAVNAAVIAGPMGGEPAAELKRLWDEILSPPFPPYDYSSLWQSLPLFLRSGWLASLVPKYAGWTWMTLNPLGQPNFFGSRVLNPLENPWVQEWARPLAASELAFYDTECLRRTTEVYPVRIAQESRRLCRQHPSTRGRGAASSADKTGSVPGDVRAIARRQDSPILLRRCRF